MLSSQGQNTPTEQAPAPSPTASLQLQMKQLLLYGPSLGIYALFALPHSGQSKYFPSQWEAIIFVRHGCFKEGKFKFRIDLSCFPEHPPAISFPHPFLHSLVDPTTGQLDTESLLQEPWEKDNPMNLYHFMNIFQTIFTDTQLLSSKQSFNQEAGCLFSEDPREFTLRAMRSVELSVDDLSVGEGQTALNTGAIPEDEKEKLKSLLTEVCRREGGVEQKIEMLLQVILE